MKLKITFFILLCTVCVSMPACNRRKMTEKDEAELFRLYKRSYKLSDPEELDRTAEMILKILSGVDEDMTARIFRVHAYSIQGFSASIRNDRGNAVKNLECALKLLPEIQDAGCYFKLASDIYYVLFRVDRDTPNEAEHWLARLDQLVVDEMKHVRYLGGTPEYRNIVQLKKYENLFVRSEYLFSSKKDLPGAEKLLLSGVGEMERSAEKFKIKPLLYCCDLLCEIYYRKREDKLCRIYSEKCLSLAVRYDEPPMFADEHLYELSVRNKDYPAALNCCRMFLSLSFVRDAKSAGLRRKYLLRAAEVCRKMGDMASAASYQSQAEMIKLSAPDQNIHDESR
ncbi:MAG: hypothetical protein IJS14_13495 [Lentisphaeria bacterium]|nr:hypothetical protein [Lentisphaeria bacterium]